MALTRVAIVKAGLSILDDYGLGDLSMRRVADVLGVQAGALYYHVPNKQSLLAALSDEILATVTLPPSDAAVSVGAWVTRWALTLRAALMSRRDAAELVASSLALGLGSVDPAAGAGDRLEREGLPQPQASARAILHFVLGHVMQEQTQAQMHTLGVVGEFDTGQGEETFRWGIALFVRGIEAPTVAPVLARSGG